MVWDLHLNTDIFMSNVHTHTLTSGIPVGLYLTSSPETCYSIASDSKAQIIVVENDSQLQKILKVSIQQRELAPHVDVPLE